MADYYLDPSPRRDPQVEAMLADPEAYFAKADAEARVEARDYVRREVDRRTAEIRRERAARRPKGWRRLFRTA